MHPPAIAVWKSRPAARPRDSHVVLRKAHGLAGVELVVATRPETVRPVASVLRRARMALSSDGAADGASPSIDHDDSQLRLCGGLLA
jgi:hypothetical protein